MTEKKKIELQTIRRFSIMTLRKEQSLTKNHLNIKLKHDTSFKKKESDRKRNRTTDNSPVFDNDTS